tara:strand:- start:292 stop:1221 length:930 start_codon:yes stop_codon:yes gene_type:complete
MKIFKPKFWDKKHISIFSTLLLPFSILFQILSYFKRALVKSKQSSIPVICIGNIYLGGTGKTPLCNEIFLILKNLNMKPAFIRKKYKSFQDEVNLQKQFGPVYQNKIRIQAINEAIKNNANIAVLDDGFQDLSVSKNLSIVCFNEKQWIGNGLTIPSGPLREDLSALKRADCVVINGEKNSNIENIIFNKNKNIKIFYAKYRAQNLNDYKNSKIIAFAGIGNPKNFFIHLRDNNLNVIEEKAFPDHYKFTKKDLQDLFDMAKRNNAILLTTEKDYFRMEDHQQKNINFLKVNLKIENHESLVDIIKTII